MSIRNSRFTALTAGTAIGAMALMLSSPANAIVPNDNYSPEDIVDNDGGVNGVGMFYRNDGFVCSGTLINPRTVLFAAHCVNDRPESDYAGTLPAAFSFDVNALPGFIDWITNGFASNPDMFVYNINQIFYDPRSIARPEGFGFLEGDIALASLDTPAGNIPTWALLFSPLPDPGTIDATDGTGYHVNITGYGRSGSGTTGASQGIDWRRRAAENMLGSLASLDDRNLFLFGTTFGDPTDPNAPLNPQVLYNLDFDDPNKTNPFDFNLYKDEPREREATTAGGDSGGPLILDAANNDLADDDLVIGVLSGGSRFFGPQVFSSYGTQSFYQPLYLFWDYIVAASPYRYVQATAGNGAWEDPNHWVTVLDPAFRIIDANGNVVNGLPTSPGSGIDGDQPKFGEVCFDPEGANPGDVCQDFATGDFTPPARETVGDGAATAGDVNTDGRGVANLDGLVAANGGGEATDGEAATGEQPAEQAAASNGNARAEVADNQAQTGGTPRIALGGVEFAANEAQGNGVDFAIDIAHAGGPEMAEEAPHDDGGAEMAEEEPHDSDGGPPEFEDAELPDPTLDNGLPGATGFVPDNIDPIISADPTVARDGRYFDVTLNRDGNTTLSSAVTIDRLQVGGNAGLTINGSGDLTSLIDITQTGGVIRVNGSLTSVGDYSLLGGLLSGTGTVNAPFVTSVMGGIAPGTMGTVGTLTIDGNLILSSGSTLLIDLGNGAALPRNGVSDRLVVTGEANVGGTVGFARVAGSRPSIGDQYLILTADGGVTGTFNQATPLSAILTPTLTYGPNAVRVVITANSYASVVDGDDAVAVSYANLLDDNRFNPALQGLFDFTDFLPTGEAITAVLDGFAPTTEATVQALGASTLTHLSAFHNNRLSLADRSTNGGTIAMVGSPIQTAAMVSSAPGGAGVQSDVMTAAAATAMQSGSQIVGDGINENLAVFLAGGFINGESNAMRTIQNFADDDFTGYFFAGGLEYYLGESALVGVSGYYQDLDADAALNNEAQSDVLAGTLYGRAQFGRLGLNGQFSVGRYSTDTRRTVSFGTTTQTLVSDDSSTLIAAEGGLDYEITPFIGSAVIRPGIDLRYSRINFDAISETGGSLALNINRRDYESLQGRAGFDVLTKQDEPFQAHLSAHFVHEFDDPANTFQANFAAGTSPFTAPFALGGTDRDWVELGIGLRYNTGNVSFDLAAHTTVERNTVDSQAVTAGINFRF
ncbi:MAG: autotransporter domain-containing protein [Parasphingopyxis sp.]